MQNLINYWVQFYESFMLNHYVHYGQSVQWCSGVTCSERVIWLTNSDLYIFQVKSGRYNMTMEKRWLCFTQRRTLSGRLYLISMQIWKMQTSMKLHPDSVNMGVCWKKIIFLYVREISFSFDFEHKSFNFKYWIITKF